MTAIHKRILVRVIKSRLSEGEKLEQIIESYPQLTTEEVLEIEKDVLG